MKPAAFVFLALSILLTGACAREAKQPMPQNRGGTETALQWQESAQVTRLFREAGVRGTFAVYDPTTNSFRGHNLERARERFIPASTFKIPNSLIGLASGAVSSADAVLPYGGQPQPFKMWEQDMSLRDAIKISNVPVYQELARRIGLQRMREGVAQLDFGNHNIGNTVDNFWLQGPLQISAVEQARFLARLTENSLPVPVEIQKTVRDMVLMEEGDEWAIYGKTGWAMGTEPDLGWWVGWVEKEGKTHTFALNIDMPAEEDRNKRIGLGKASLVTLGIL
jgi:beta-lactamase class D